MFFFTLYQIVGYLAWIVTVIVIVQFILSLLLAFNVVSMSCRGWSRATAAG